jgi:hypothetical protein
MIPLITVRKQALTNGRISTALTDFKTFMASDAGASARYEQRRRRRIHISIDDIEPQSKKMSPADRAAFQSAVAEQLSDVKRGTFRGDIALKLDLATSSHRHTRIPSPKTCWISLAREWTESIGR